MSEAPDSAEVLTLIAEWMEAKNKPAEQVSGGFSLFDQGMWNPMSSDRDDGDEQKETLSDVEQKLVRAQMALDLYVANKVEQTLQSIINQSNQRASASASRGIDLYPERQDR